MNDSDDQCPICGEGKLQPRVGANSVDYQGQMTKLAFHFSVCDACGSEQADAAQTRTNKRLMVAFKKRVDGLLTGVEVRTLRKRLGLTQAEAAQVFGGGSVAFSKYENDDVAQSEAMDKLLRLAAELPVAFERLRRRASFESCVLTGMQWEQMTGCLMEPRRLAEVNPPALRVILRTTLSADRQWQTQRAA